MNSFIVIEAVYLADPLSSDVIVNLDMVCAVIKAQMQIHPALFIDVGVQIRQVAFAKAADRDDYFEWIKECTSAKRKPLITKLLSQ